MTIEQLKKELKLTNKDLAGFLDLKPINYANSTAKKRYEKAFCSFYEFLKNENVFKKDEWINRITDVACDCASDGYNCNKAETMAKKVVEDLVDRLNINTTLQI